MLGALAFNSVNIIRHLIVGDILHYFDPFLNPDNFLGFFVLSIVSSIIAVMMNNFALSRIQISTMAAFGGLSTIVTIAIGMIFGSETLAFYHYVGLPFIFLRMVGVSAISIMKSKKATTASPANEP